MGDFCVQSIWKNYVDRNSLSPLKPGFIKGLHQKLTVADEEYIESLLMIQPSIYKEEIKQKLLHFSNTFNYPNASPTDISLTTIKRTVRHRYLSIKSYKMFGLIFINLYFSKLNMLFPSAKL